ncbi:hypothetical protein CC78DRAFT_615222 [Lojkania enalia]|uniref:Uncharacterized protein n=1 Tax=Lojkania enalia TaxID=147567 RepID=A0A9P4KCJ2_9PLEO|nr:hypothetical protein CC78DRAFT_615222 [Didymosphaeria enalia]
MARDYCCSSYGVKDLRRKVSGDSIAKASRDTVLPAMQGRILINRITGSSWCSSGEENILRVTDAPKGPRRLTSRMQCPTAFDFPILAIDQTTMLVNSRDCFIEESSWIFVKNLQLLRDIGLHNIPQLLRGNEVKREVFSHKQSSGLHKHASLCPPQQGAIPMLISHILRYGIYVAAEYMLE